MKKSTFANKMKNIVKKASNFQVGKVGLEQLQSPGGERWAEVKLGNKAIKINKKPDVTKGVYSKMTHMSENVKKPTTTSMYKAQDQLRKVRGAKKK